MNIPTHGVIRLTTSFEPSTGKGTRIAPATYAASQDGSTPAGPAWTPDTPIAHLDNDGAISFHGTGSSVVIESQGSQVTRSESLLWDLRDELSLPGVVIGMGNDDFVETIRAQISKDANFEGLDKDVVLHDYLRSMQVADNSLSSWITPHRHVDGIIREASLTPDGKTIFWHTDDESVSIVKRASVNRPRDLLKIAPNAMIYGYWLSTGAPVLHKLARSYQSDIVGYGVTKATYGANKIPTMQPHSSHMFAREDDGTLKEVAKGGSKPSELLLGSVVSSSQKTAYAQEILGRASISVSGLRANLSKGDLTESEKDAALDALVHIALLGHKLREDQWDIRSGCTLIPEQTFWVAKTPEGDTTLEIPTTSELVSATKDAVSKAQDMGVMGTADDRINLYLSKNHVLSTLSSFGMNTRKNG